MDIRAWISMWISTLVWIPVIEDWHKKLWIFMLISVDFWKSMHGFAMDSRTRVCMCIPAGCSELKVRLLTP